MSRSLEARIGRLEQRAGSNESGQSALIVSFVGDAHAQLGVLEGVQLMCSNQYIERPASEPEADFLDRVSMEYQQPGPNFLVMIERRSC